MTSPWERELGQRVSMLAPALQAYFGAIPAGSVGRGTGIFEIVGTPRRWLWPALGLLAVDGIIFPVWESDVTFTIENRPGGAGTVRARRTFHFAGGDRVMVDEVGITRTGLTDRLGRHGVVSTTFSATVVDGGLRLISTGVTLRLGPVRVPLGPLSPRVTLTERSAGSRQDVSLVLDAPVLGRLYEYSGSFVYRIEQEGSRA